MIRKIKIKILKELSNKNRTKFNLSKISDSIFILKAFKIIFNFQK